MEPINLKNKKKLRNTLFISFLILALLLGRIGFIEFIQGGELQVKAYEQQVQKRAINPRRGTIYDASEKYILAVSCTAYTVTVNPTNIAKEDKEKVTKGLADIFQLDYDTVYKKVSKRSSIETIVKKIDKSKADELRLWLIDNNILTGVNIDEDSKRYYPYSNLASQVIGFCGGDNQGLDGVEAKYDSLLSGTAGSISRATDATGEEIGTEGEVYTAARNGDSAVLSIDMTIQSIVEKYLEEACIDNSCTDGGNIIVMNPKTGDILAMATYPSYNLNEPYTINNEELLANWDNIEQSEKSKNLQAMWRNKAISDTYEPGSVFKLVTASSAIEEGITDTDNSGEFACTGSITIAGARIKCWRYYRPHGSQSLRQALMNSCNPVFIGLGQKLGVNTYFSYLNKFGLLSKTGVMLPGEANSIFIAQDKCGPVELATISFGQRFEITPIQLITAVSAISNGGNLLTPRIIKATINSETGERTELPVENRGTVISKETSEKVLSMMESVVSEGTGKNAKVAGYKIGGKTGTSEDGVNTGKYVTSFCGVAPTDDPQVVVLVTLYNPTGEGGHQGGGVAAPVGGQVFSEILPYLEVNQGNTDELENREKVNVADVMGKTITEATKILKEQGFEIKINNETENMNKDEVLVKEQIPSGGIEATVGSCVYLN
jgi:stage V sporulation protein D (sporulation-specific penicillin-binding protein)